MVLIPVVNEHDEIIGYKERSGIIENDIYRVAGLRITNSRDEILLKQRSFLKTNDPGKREVAASGTVEGEESYEDNIAHEIEEELGISISQLTSFKLGPKHFFDVGRKFFGQVFIAQCDLSIEAFRLEQGKAIDIRRRPREEVVKTHASTPDIFISSIDFLLSL